MEPFVNVPMEKWLQRIEDKQTVIDESVRVGMQSIRNQIEALEKSLPDRFLTRREWDVVLEAGKVNRESQEALRRANDERHQADMTAANSRIDQAHAKVDQGRVLTISALTTAVLALAGLVANIALHLPK